MKKLNNTQKALKRMIRDTESKITDEELFLSSAFQKYQTSLAESGYWPFLAMDFRYLWNGTVLKMQTSLIQIIIKFTVTPQTRITQSFPSRFLRSQSLTGLTGHEIGHLRYSDFASLQLYLTNRKMVPSIQKHQTIFLLDTRQICRTS